jgi:hypothetical protein
VTNPYNQSYLFNDAIFACAAYAMWLPAPLSMSPLEDNAVTADFSNPNLIPKPIWIKTEWADALNAKLPSSNLTAMESLVNALATGVYTGSVTADTTLGGDFVSAVASGIGLVVTDGLSRIG